MKKNKPELPKVAVNKPGWWAIRHIDGWWVGNNEGVLCYEEEEVGRAALTILWQRDGGGRPPYKLKRFTEANKITGKHTPEKSAVQALKDYERRSR